MTLPAPTFEVWDEDGSSKLGFLAGTISPVLNSQFCAVGSLRFGIPRDVTGASLILDPDVDRQIRVVQAGCPDEWFLVDEDSFEGASEDARTEPVTFTCRSLAGVLDETWVVPSGGVGTTPAEWAFTAPTPGEIITTLIAESQSLGHVENVTVAGGAVTDADGDAWAVMDDVTYKAGTSLLTILTGLATQQLLEWRMNGRELELYVPGGGLDRSPDLTFRPRREVTSAPITNSRRSVVTDVLTEGAGGSTSLRTQALTGRRRRGAYLSQTQTPSAAIDQLGDFYLAAHAVADNQMTHKLTDAPGAPLPGADYRCGDRVKTPAAFGAITRRRVQQIAVAWDAGEVTVELGSLLSTTEERFAAQLSRLLPGESSLT